MLLLHKQRKQLAHKLLRTLLILSIIHGLLAFKYNAVKRRLSSSKFMNYYCLLINFFMVVALCITIPYDLHSLEVRFIREKSLNVILNAMHTILDCLILFVACVCNWTKRYELLEIFNELVTLQQQVKVVAKNHSQSFYINYIIGKSLLTLLQIASCLYSKLGMNPHPSGEYIIYVILVFVTKNVILLTTCHFCFGILGICHYLQELNLNLTELVQQQQQQHDDEHSDFTIITITTPLHFDDICKCYARLCRMAQGITRLYQWQVLMLIFLLFLSNIISSFYFLVYLSGKINAPMDNFSIVLFPQIFVINIIDFYLSIMVCERTTRAATQTLSILQRLNDAAPHCLPTSTCGCEEKNVESFALQCTSSDFRIRVGGMLSINLNMGLQVIVTTVTYLIVLVQFDYKNL